MIRPKAHEPKAAVVLRMTPAMRAALNDLAWLRRVSANRLVVDLIERELKGAENVLDAVEEE
jgi:hypothetical protein